MVDLKVLEEKTPILKEIRSEKEVFWQNPDKSACGEAMEQIELGMEDVEDAERRLERFAPFIMKCFPETKEKNGIIESVLTPVPKMKDLLNEKYDSNLEGNLLLKQDSHLAIAGSIKARGGIYEILKHTEELALEHGILSLEDNYEKLASEECREFFKKYTIQVGSTGNLGMSIGIMGAAVGYRVIVHMSSDARQWKKDLLRSHGVEVREYESDYSEAVKQGRALSDQDPFSYFVDDENSRNLFLGYAVAAIRLRNQLRDLAVPVDEAHPLFVFLPCGVGGAPGGITFGLKQIWGDLVHCFFEEPVQAPCMLAGMASGRHSGICVQDLGLTGKTHADGLAVGRPSGFVGQVMEPLLSGEFTVKDARLYDYMRELLDTEGIFLEPSACAAFQGAAQIRRAPETREYLREHQLLDKMDQASYIVWATGGSLVPEEIRREYRETYLE